MYVDTHCHLQDEKFSPEEIDNIISLAEANNVKVILVTGYDETSNRLAINLAEKYKCVYAVVGYHPLELDNIRDVELFELKANLNHPKVVALGEIGLDYHYDGYDSKQQKDMFIKQLQLANKINKPVVIHSRDCINETYEIIKKYKKNSIKGVLHCYASSYEMANNFVKLNMYFGVSGVVTYKNSVVLKEVVEKIDISKLILETDSPYLSPEPKRGQRNDSSNIPLIGKKVAEIRGVSEDLIMETTTSTALSLFDINL